MSEVTLENDVQTTQNNEPENAFDPVCVDLPRIYDSCGAKDCLRDLTVFFTAEDQAVVGFVASFPTSEVISGYTAFLLGVRSVVPQAVMRVCYTQTWSSYAQEKSAAQQLIDKLLEAGVLKKNDNAAK